MGDVDYAQLVRSLHSLPVDKWARQSHTRSGTTAEGALSARHKRPIILDPDEFDHLPEIGYIAVEGLDRGAKKATIRLRDMAHGGTALLLYSSRERLIAAHGEECSAMTVPSTALPGLQRCLGFTVVLLDVGLPPDLRRQVSLPTEDDHEPVPMDVDRATGEPLIYVPSRPYWNGDGEVQLELQPLPEGRRALLAYSSKQSLLDGCGPEQHYVQFRVALLPEAMRQCGADRVLIDTPLPERLRHRQGG